MLLEVTWGYTTQSYHFFIKISWGHRNDTPQTQPRFVGIECALIGCHHLGLLWMFSPGKFLLLQSFTDWRNIRLCRYPYIHLWLYFTSIATGNAGNALILGVYLFTWNGLQSKSWHDFSKDFPPNFSIAGTFHTQVQRKSGGGFAVFLLLLWVVLRLSFQSLLRISSFFFEFKIVWNDHDYVESVTWESAQELWIT